MGTDIGDFRGLTQWELECLGKANHDGSVDVPERAAAGAPAQEGAPDACSEPFVRFPARDFTGLALSGGGIRSATFNLGLLKGLDDFGLLGMFDYLSTVSGGGYIGSWWMAFRRKSADAWFPPIPEGAKDPAPEAPEVRHLRRFSNFLSPRMGFFEVETWRMVVAILAGLVPSLLMTLLLVATALLGWCALGEVVFAWPSSFGAAIAILVLTVLVQLCCEWVWQRCESASTREGAAAVTGAVAMGILCVAPALLCARVWCIPPFDAVGLTWTPWAPSTLAFPDLCVAVRTCGTALLWLIAAVPGLLVPLLLSRVPRRAGNAVSRFIEMAGRVASRMMATALVWLGLALVWHAGQLAASQDTWNKLAGLLAGSAGASAAFALVHKLLGAATQSISRPVSKLKGRLLIPLSYVAVGLFAAATAALLIRARAAVWSDAGVALDPLSLLPWFAAALGLLMLCLDPQRTALHEFYRARISRAYFGATNRTCGAAARTDEQAEDEPVFMPARETLRRPIHLVCAAANDLAGDGLETLSRGARSAVLSPLGLSVGDTFADVSRLNGGRGVTYSQAVTASAAAFNSNMGAKSIALGSAVTLLMTALNMRLGLWVQVSPATAKSPWWAPFRDVLSRVFAGNLLIREMFGRTSATVPAHGGAIHLSDGGHFENLALYELIRRHCRYILVSDCGQDPAVIFEDFANAARRVREDFGVEIEIDLDPLKPDQEGRSRQHTVVGTIHYNGVTGCDKGVLLYVKPTLTGDEPADIMHYRASHTSFPHESTGDQFYDEAQWESYRRLGEHAAHSALRFIESWSRETRVPHRVFPAAYFAWHPVAPDFAQRVAAANQRWAAFQARLRDSAPASLVQEVFPELTPGKGHANADSDREIVGWLEEFLSLMSEWAACGGWAAAGDNPLTADWRNWVARWTATATFRHWWPVLRSLCPRPVEEFVAELYPVKAKEEESRFVLDGPPTNAVQGPAKYTYGIRLQADACFELIKLKVDVSGTVVSWAEALAEPWTERDFVAKPGYWGSGYGTAFIQKLHDLFKQSRDGSATFEVTISGVRGSDPVSRRELTDLLGFYLRLGFVLKEPPAKEGCILVWR